MIKVYHYFEVTRDRTLRSKLYMFHLNIAMTLYTDWSNNPLIEIILYMYSLVQQVGKL